MFPGSIAILSVVFLVGGNRRTRKKPLEKRRKLITNLAPYLTPSSVIHPRPGDRSHSPTIHVPLKLLHMKFDAVQTTS